MKFKKNRTNSEPFSTPIRKIAGITLSEKYDESITLRNFAKGDYEVGNLFGYSNINYTTVLEAIQHDACFVIDVERSPPVDDKNKDGLGTGVIIGIVVGCVVVIVIAAVCIYFFVFKKKQNSSGKGQV